MITKRDINAALEPYGFSLGMVYSDRRQGYIRHKGRLWDDGSYPSLKALYIMRDLGLDANFYQGDYIVWTSSEEAAVRREAERYRLDPSIGLDLLKDKIKSRKPYKSIMRAFEGDWEDFGSEDLDD